jgi:CBS domain-containing protein
MGEKRVQRKSTAEEMREFTRSLLDELKALQLMQDQGLIESGVRRIGVEQEMFLVDRDWRPAPVSPEVLQRIDDPRLTTELGSFNLEANSEPFRFEEDCLRKLEATVIELLDTARAAAREENAEVALVGILPTLRLSDLTLGQMTPEERYYALNEALNRLSGGAYSFYIRGIDELLVKHDSVMLESCNTSFQVHFQVSPAEFPRFYNIAQVLAAPVLAAAVNSPLLFGRRLWRETRIALFEQSVDTRSPTPNLRETHARVSFGSDWVKDSVLDIYRQDIGRFQVLLGKDIEEDPLAMVAAGNAPQLQALQLFNSTVYRWNRPCYGVSGGVAHLRIENRVLPSGPTPIDEIANAAFWYGLMAGFLERFKDIREVMSFGDAKGNFLAAARLGLGAPLTWLGGEEIGARRLILDQLLEIAAFGMASCGIDEPDIDRYLNVIERRVESRHTGADWMLRSLAGMKGRGTSDEQLRALTAAIVARQQENRPVHEWELAELTESGGWKGSHMVVRHFMTTDIVTVHEDQPVDLVANLMDWNEVRHIPVEDPGHQLIGLVTRRTLLRFLASDEARNAEQPVPVGRIMIRELITIPPDTPTFEAIDVMRKHRISALPVVEAGRLVGIVSERDFMQLAQDLIDKGLKE